MIGRLDGTRIGVLSVVYPESIEGDVNSGTWVEIGSSREMRPHSTHCIAAIDVMSLVAEARQNVDVVNTDIDSS